MFRFMTAIPAPIQTLLDLFTTSLADVRFADLDGQTLASSAAEVEAAAKSVAVAQAALDAAREVLQSRQDALLQRAQRALAYARVYAESDEALSRRLDAVTLPRPARRARAEDALVLSADPQPAPASRPRGRPKKVVAAQPTPPAELTLEAIVPPGE
jgi:multidrug efflux pump subunit AcrA (membrane-fusion protein)